MCPSFLCVGQLQQIVLWVRACLHTARTVWPSGLRRWLQAPVRKGVGSNPTAVTFHSFCHHLHGFQHACHMVTSSCAKNPEYYKVSRELMAVNRKVGSSSLPGSVLLMSYMQISCKHYANIVRTSCKHHANIMQTSRKHPCEP